MESLKLKSWIRILSYEVLKCFLKNQDFSKIEWCNTRVFKNRVLHDRLLVIESLETKSFNIRVLE